MKEEDPGRTEAGNKASRCHVTGDGEAVHVVSEESSSSKPRWRREKMIRERRKISKKAKRCQVHGVILQRMLVPVIYGRPVDDTSFETLIKSRADLFPNAKSHVLGGCTLGAIGLHFEESVCPECRATERDWEKANNRIAEPEIDGLFISAGRRNE